MRRITGIVLALVIFVGAFALGSFSVSAEAPLKAEGMTASDDCIKILKLEEGFSEKPYWDYTQYTVGFGTKCPDDMVDYYTKNGIKEEEAEALLRNHMVYLEKDLNTFIGKYSLKLTQNQYDALVLFSYNCGTGWAYSPSGTFHEAIAKGATGNDLIRAFALWCSAGGEIQTYLLRRRLSEANMYLNNIYSQTPPDNYCYVLYDANGGVTNPRSQGYDSKLTAKPFPVPTYTGYTFAGWYTAKNGGEKVTVLDASAKGKVLYAHWVDADGNDKPVEEPTVKITVTGVDVNLRKGPGTNYTKIGTATKGDKLTVVETSAGIGYKWGRYTENGGGWICLQYTNYDAALKEQENQKPDTTEPETTEPETTEPPTTQPPATKPPATQEKPVEKPKVMGTVKVNQFLRVRKGPSTGYAEVARLKPNDRVEILEQKVVGATVWGRINKGWISMDYVKLDSTSGGSSSSGGTATKPTTTTWTGTIVNCSQWVRIRSGAGTNYSIAGYYYPGNKVTITQQKTVGSTKWGKTDKGWISMDYVKITANNSGSGSSSGNTGSAGGSTGSAGTTAGKTGVIYNCKDWVRIRSGAGTGYAVAGYYYPGNKVTITQQKTAGGITWGKTDKGWVSMAYVKLDGSASGSSAAAKVYKTITADCLRVRKAPGTNNAVVGYLYYGTKVEILDTKQVGSVTWGRVSNGWISLQYAK